MSHFFPAFARLAHRRGLVTAAILLGVVTPMAVPGFVGPDKGESPILQGAVARPAAGIVVGQGDESLQDEYDEILGEEAALIARVQSAQAERARLTSELDRLEADLQARNVELLVAQAELDDAEFLAMIYAQAVVDARQKVEVASEDRKSVG